MEELLRALYGKYAADLSPSEVDNKIRYALTLDPNDAIDGIYKKYTGDGPTSDQVSYIVEHLQSQYSKEAPVKPNLWQSIGIGIKQLKKGFAAEGPMMAAGNRLTEINKKINFINNNPDSNSFLVGGYYSQKEGYTIGAEEKNREEALDFYKQEKARQENIWLENFVQAEEIQAEIDKYERAKVFEEDGSIDLTLQETGQIIGEQIPQMVGSFFGGTYFQEAGGVMDRALTKQAIKDLGISEQEFMFLDSNEKAKAFLNIINDGRAEDILDEAHRVGLQNQVLDYASNVFLVGKASKFIPKDAWRRALKGQYDELGKGIWTRGVRPQGLEILTENVQEINSARAVGDKVTMDLLLETTAQTIIGAGGIQVSVGGTSFAYNEGMSQYAALTDPNSVAALAKKMRTQIKNDRRRSENNKLDLLRQIDIAESLTKNSEFNNLNPEARSEFFKQEYIRQKQFDKIEALEKKFEKRPNDVELEFQINEAKLELANIQQNMTSILYFNNYKANGFKLAEYINAKKTGFFADKNVVIRDTKEELEKFLQNTNPELLNNKSIQNLLNGTSNGVLSPDGKTAYIINENIKNNSIKKENNIRKSGAAGREAGNVVHHEVVHMLFHGIKDADRLKMRNEIDAALSQNKDPEVQKIYEALQERLKAYENDSESVQTHEFFAGLSDVLSPIQAIKNIEQASIFTKIGRIFNKNLNVLNLPDIINGQNALEIMQKYNSFNGVEISSRQAAEQVVGDVANLTTQGDVQLEELESKEIDTTTISGTLDQYITDEINSKEAFQASDSARAGVYTEIEQNNILDGFITNLILDDDNLGGLDTVIQYDALRKIKERIVDRIFKNFDPNLEGSKRSLFSYIYGDAKSKGKGGIAIRALQDIKKEYAQDPKTTSMQTEEGGTIDIADETIVNIEDQIDNKILSENIENTTNPKIEEEIDILSEEDINDITDFISQIFGEEVILNPKDPNFRNKIREVYEKAVMPKIRAAAGNFKVFYDNYIEKLFDPAKKLLSIQYLYQAERSLEDKNFAKFDKRLTTQKEIRKARDEKNAYVENEAQGVDRYNRLKFNKEATDNYYEPNNTKPNSTIRARRNKLFSEIGKEILFNLTPQQLKKSTLTEEERAIAAKKIERSLESKSIADAVGLGDLYYELKIGDMDAARKYANQWVKILPYFDDYPGLLNLGTFTNGLLKDGVIDKEQKVEIEKILLAGSDKWYGNKNKSYGKSEKRTSENYYKGAPFKKSDLTRDPKDLKKTGDRYVNAGVHFWVGVFEAVNDVKEGDQNYIAMIHYVRNAISEKSHVHRRMARLEGFDVVAAAGNQKMTFEHAMQNERAYKELLIGTKQKVLPYYELLNIVLDNYVLIGMLESDAKMVDGTNFALADGRRVSYARGMGRDWSIFRDKWIARYANPDVAKNGGLNFKNLKTLNGVTFEKAYNVKNDGTIINEALESKEQNLDKDFNDIIEQKKGAKFASNTRYTSREARRQAAKAGPKGIFRFFIPPGAEDFQGLMYAVLPKGNLGNVAMEWFRQNLFRPYALAVENINRERIALMNDFKAAKKGLKNSSTLLKKEILGGKFTNQDAIRVWIWNKQGMTIPGLSEGDKNKLISIVEKRKGFLKFAKQLIAINKEDGYIKPDNNWDLGTIRTDLYENINQVKRQRYLEDWNNNVEQIFNQDNLNKLEAAFGSDYRNALENILRRMKSGRNRPGGGDKEINAYLEWINNSVGVIMFLNVRSAMLQMISTVNYINWTDNNPLKAAKAFANQKQFWADFKMIYNSDFLVERRGGLQININESEIAEAAERGGVRGTINYLLKQGFVLTRAADSFAIANGGAAMYRNRVNTYLGQGLSKQEAEAKAFQDFRELTEEAQQSSRPDKISRQQSSEAGRILLAFANTPMQYTRLMKRAVQDLAAGRGDWRTNMSKLMYYGVVQNFIFNAMQQALFAIGFIPEDELEEDEETKRAVKLAGGMLDSILRGTGFVGNAVMVLKNFIMDIYRRTQLDRPQYEKSIFKLATVSPPISSKVSKIRQAAYTFDSEMDIVLDEGLSLDNPANMAIAQLISAGTNVPLDRVVRLFDNYRAAVAEDTEAWQRVALVLGWGTWELNMEDDNEGLRINKKKLEHKKFQKKKIKRKKIK